MAHIYIALEQGGALMRDFDVHFTADVHAFKERIKESRSDSRSRLRGVEPWHMTVFGPRAHVLHSCSQLAAGGPERPAGGQVRHAKGADAT